MSEPNIIYVWTLDGLGLGIGIDGNEKKIYTLDEKTGACWPIATFTEERADEVFIRNVDMLVKGKVPVSVMMNRERDPEADQ